MRKLVVITTLGWAGVALGQSLPTPQFATPPASDSSTRAATTAWVRAQIGSGNDLSQSIVRATGATVSRSAANRAADTFNILDYGAIADGTTDIGPALNAIAAKLNGSALSNVVYFPAGSYRLATPVIFSGVAPILVGQGFTQGPPLGGTGTWIKVDTAGVTPITFSGTNSRGAQVRDLALYEVHPNLAVGWTPNPNDYVFKVLNALGEVKFDNVLFAGVNRGIYADYSGRLNIKDVQGQFYTAGIEIDDCFDIPRIQRLHSWTFVTNDTNVLKYQIANQDTVILRRVDGIFIGDLFSIAAHNVLHLSSGTHGVTAKAYVSNLYSDLSANGLLIDGPGTTIQVANMTSQGNDPTAGATYQPNSHAVWINTHGVVAQISNLASSLTAGPAVQIDSYGNNVNVTNLNSSSWGTAGTPAVFVADSGTNPPNNAYIGNKEFLQGAGGPPLFNTGSNGGRERFVMMNATGGVNENEVRAYSATPTNAPQLAAIGGDVNIDMLLNGKGKSGVRLQSSGQTVLRVDNPNASTNDFLLRGSSNTMNLVAEGGDSNIDVALNGKGTSGVRLQSQGQTILRVDNAGPAPSGNDLLLRGGSGTMNWIAEGADPDIDLYLSPQGTNGDVRLQANGTTVLRADNPLAGTSNMLVRSASGSVRLSLEDPTLADLSLVLGGKGAGLVSIGTCPSSADSSNNLACTSWVRSQGYLTTSAVGPLATQAALLSKPVVGTSASGQLVAAPVQGNGAKVQLSTGAAVAGDCVKFDANGNTIDAGAACGTGGGAGGITALTGDVSAAGSGSATATLASVGTAGSYSKVTTDAKGRVVAGTSLTAADVTSGLGFVPLASASPSATGTLTVSAFNSIALAGAAVGGSPSITAVGGDTSVDLLLGATGSTRLQVNGATILRVDNPNSGNSGLLVRSGVGVASLTAESGLPSANLTLNPKGAGVVTAPTLVTTDSSTAIATTAFVKSLGYASSVSPTFTGTMITAGAANSISLTGSGSGSAPAITATGSDSSVDLTLATKAAGRFLLAPGTGAAQLTTVSGNLQLFSNGTSTTQLGSVGAGGSSIALRGALLDQGYGYQNSGSAFTFGGNTDRLILGAGVTTPFTVTMAATPADGQVALIECDASLSLIISPNVSQSLGGTPSSCSVSQAHQWHYRSLDTKWRMDF